MAANGIKRPPAVDSTAPVPVNRVRTSPKPESVYKEYPISKTSGKPKPIQINTKEEIINYQQPVTDIVTSRTVFSPKKVDVNVPSTTRTSTNIITNTSTKTETTDMLLAENDDSLVTEDNDNLIL